jgi:serine phosphatase RsbU (regulator of sigma subunit)
VLRYVADDVKNFFGLRPQHDDITLIAIAKT